MKRRKKIISFYWTFFPFLFCSNLFSLFLFSSFIPLIHHENQNEDDTQWFAKWQNLNSISKVIPSIVTTFSIPKHFQSKSWLMLFHSQIESTFVSFNLENDNNHDNSDDPCDIQTTSGATWDSEQHEVIMNPFLKSVSLIFHC